MDAVKITTGGQPLIAGNLQTPPVHIPDGRGGAYKTELALLRTPERTEKIIWWHGDDPRKEPHNHPWPFESEIKGGGYTETRWWLVPDLPVAHPDYEDPAEWVRSGRVDEVRETPKGLLCIATRKYRAGDFNRVPTEVYHVVYDVQPGTVTHLVCGAATANNEWGYLDLETYEHVSARDPRFADNGFIDRLREINPHMRVNR